MGKATPPGMYRFITRSILCTCLRRQIGPGRSVSPCFNLIHDSYTVENLPHVGEKQDLYGRRAIRLRRLGSSALEKLEMKLRT